MIHRAFEHGGTLGAASFSDCERYRYRLMRRWDEKKPKFVAVMLNPSTATESVLDPTIKQVLKRARSLDFGSLIVVNLFAYRATKPTAMMKVDDPVGGEQNNQAILSAVAEGDLVLLGWGSHGAYLNRGLRVLHMINARGLSGKCRYLKLTQSGQPGHPLYIRDDETLKEFK